MTDIKIIEEFVRNSNWIENEFDIEGPIWDNHLDIAMKIEEESIKQNILHPIRIHSVLMKNIIEYPGKYRPFQVYIGIDKSTQPLGPAIIDMAMSNWFDCLKKDIEHIHKHKSDSLFKVDDIALQYHNWFESIHPFVDGNGRTGRLILNNIRRSFGLPWLVIKGTPPQEEHLIEEHKKYYEDIRKWRKENQNLLSIKQFLK